MVNSASMAVATLAQRLYVAHLAALKAEIQALETEFLSTHKDIEAIERGDWDDRLKQQVEQPQPPSQSETEPPTQEPVVKEEEEEVAEPLPPSKESTPASVSGVNKRTRAGRRKTASVTPGPDPGPIIEEGPEAMAEEPERDVVDVETPASKRTRTEEGDDQEQEETEAPPQEDEPMEDVIKPQDMQEEEQIAGAEDQQAEVPEEKEVEPAAEPMDVVKEEPAPEEEEASPEEMVEEKQHPETPKPKLKSQTPQPPKPETPPSESDEDTTPSRPKQKPFSTLVHPLHAAVCSLRSATLFSQPIREGDAPGYYNLIRKPVDLKTLWKQVKEGVITDSVVFHREVARMFANAAMYNAENSPVWDMARDMASEADRLCEGYRRSENFGNEGGRIRKRK